ncbi:hypothetical protein LEP1GSC035_1309 [Leptospira noguchii str. 2007001578]|uniref:Uncharacterized protein n=2 Tax=Leptospira noguchii TaxID=28182 RepID=M6YFZ9_9LEPT|nr:hypothetical protein LEP1GSC035_1309 [Leptospira noguchii str. 2007001578]EMO88534.1 hypothetical protein LEP1GSC024_1314 [Leptospira noguchii str. 2001034031]
MGTQFYRGFVVIPTDLILRSKYFWGWLCLYGAVFRFWDKFLIFI